MQRERKILTSLLVKPIILSSLFSEQITFFFKIYFIYLFIYLCIYLFILLAALGLPLLRAGFL